MQSRTIQSRSLRSMCSGTIADPGKFGTLRQRSFCFLLRRNRCRARPSEGGLLHGLLTSAHVSFLGVVYGWYIWYVCIHVPCIFLKWSASRKIALGAVPGAAPRRSFVWLGAPPRLVGPLIGTLDTVTEAISKHSYGLWRPRCGSL